MFLNMDAKLTIKDNTKENLITHFTKYNYKDALLLLRDFYVLMAKTMFYSFYKTKRMLYKEMLINILLKNYSEV